MKTARVVLILACAFAAAGMIVGCQTPFSTGLTSTLGTTGTSSTTSAVMTEPPDRMWLTGMYDLEEGSLSIKLQSPDGEYPFDELLVAPTHGEIEMELDPAVGEWRLIVTGPGGVGWYSVRLRYR